MFDSYLCKKFKEKKITVKMIVQSAFDNNIVKEIFIVSGVFGAALDIVIYADESIAYIAVAVIMGLVMMSLSQYVSSKIVVATCPLNKK